MSKSTSYNKSVFWLVVLYYMLYGFVGCSSNTNGKICGPHTVRELLDSAEVVMNDNPEYAFRLIDSIDSHSIRSRALQALYALLYTEAQYKNYIDETNDSLIMVAVRYYSAGNHAEQLFRSFYCLGCIYAQTGQLTSAAVALEQAESLADKISDSYRLGLLYTQLGNVFLNTYDFNRAQEYYLKAYDEYDKAGKDSHRIHALFDVGRCLIELQEYASAHEIMIEVQKWAQDNNEYNLISSCLLNQLTCSVHEGNKEMAKIEAECYISSFGQPQNRASAMRKFAHYYILLGDYSNARITLNKAWQIANPSDSIKQLYVESLLLQNTGQTDSAMELYKQSIEKQNYKLRLLLNQPVLGAQKDYYKSLSEVESIKASNNRNIAILSCTIMVLLLVIIHIVNYSRAIKNESEKQGYLLTIKELRLKEDSNNEVINRLNNRINTLFGKQYAELDEVFEKMIELDIAFPEEYVNTQLGEKEINKRYYKKLALFHKKIRARFEEIKSVKYQKELNRIINDTYDNIMTQLSDKKLKLSDNDLLILRLLICGFSPKVVSYLVSERYKIIYQKRARILKKIEHKSEDLAKTLCKILRMKGLTAQNEGKELITNDLDI